MSETTNRGAVISRCGQYRYRLWRHWEEGGPRAVFIMLNPSTADAEQDDPTIRKCIGFAKRLGYTGIEVVNLYAFRATYPSVLKAAGYPKGPDNDGHILTAATAGGIVICAWGANTRGLTRPDAVLDMLREAGIVPMALAFTADGLPSHPLMLPYTCVPVEIANR